MSHLQPRLTRQRVRCRSEFSGPVAQPVGGTEHLLAGLLDLSNLPFEINVSSRDIEVQVSPNGTLRNGESIPRRQLLNPLQVADPGETNPALRLISIT